MMMVVAAMHDLMFENPNIATQLYRTVIEVRKG